MTQIIEAYFKNEDKALENESQLKRKFDVKILEVGALEDEMKTDKGLKLPIVGVNTNSASAGSGSGIGSAGAVGTGGLVRAATFEGAEDTTDETFDDGHVNYLLSVKVKDEDAEDITKLLRKNHGHVRVSKK